MSFYTDLNVDLDWMYNISINLDGFKQNGRRQVWSCRCPVCGDSKTKKRKRRFYFYVKGNNLNVMCHNCYYSSSFYNFMKDEFSNQFETYKRETLLSMINRRVHKKPVTKKVEVVEIGGKTELVGCVPILSLNKNHKALRYMYDRAFTDKQLVNIMYSEDFKLTAESISFEPLSERFPSESRIVIPFYNKNKEITVIQGRSMDGKSSLKYITIKSSENASKVYGEERIDRSKTVYCVEGPLDSLFVDNCLATCDANLLKADADVHIWDCQSRNKDVVALMKEAIQLNKKLVIWPMSTDRKIDINDMIKLGMTSDQLMKVIEQNTYYGLKALAKLNNWKRV